MADQLAGFEQVTLDSARKLALQQASAAGHYGDLLKSFGDGDITAGRYGVSLLSLYLNESAKYAGDVITIGAHYLQSALEIVAKPSINVVTQAAEDAVRAADNSQRRPKTKKARKTKKAVSKKR